MNGKRRQWVLLALLGVAGLAYLRYGDPGFGGVIFSGDPLPAIDAADLQRRLAEINTVNPELFGPPGQADSTGRNLFQYGVKPPEPPPPPDPAEVERQRLAAEEALRRAEEAARLQKEREEAQRKAREEARLAALEAAKEKQQQKPPDDTPPGKKPAPPIEFAYMGVFGPKLNKIGVLLDKGKPILVRKGQVVKKDFKVLDVGVEWADIGYVDPDYTKTKRILLGP